MTNKLEVDRELLEDIAQALSDDPAMHDDPMTADYAWKLRVLLAKADDFNCMDGGKCGNGGYCDACPHTKPAEQPAQYTAVDMATAAADGFRDGQKLVVSEEQFESIEKTLKDNPTSGNKALADFISLANRWLDAK